jgi:hypothetical protein
MRRSALRRRYGRAGGGSGTIPQLDALGEDGLMTFWAVYHRAGPKLAEHLFGTRFPGFTTAAGSLAGYASNKAAAIACARRGDQHGADVYNGIAAGIARRLPAQAHNVELPAQTVSAIRNAVRGEAGKTARAILKGGSR